MGGLNSEITENTTQLLFESAKFARDNIRKTCTAGEDKELEALLLKQGIYIHYLPDVPVYDEKTQRGEAFGNQRRRWLAAQFGALAKGLRDLPGAIAGGNFDYADKLFQWMLLPRAVLIAGILFRGTVYGGRSRLGD